MRVPIGTAAGELIVKRSRFISRAVHFDSPGAAKETIRKVRDLHSGCNHVVYAYIVGTAGSVFGMSDDGEPKGTAGRPVLEVLKGSGITNVLVTVVRFFGGTKLGTGGLVRAYSGSAQEVLALLDTEELVVRTRFTVTVPYACYEGVRRLITELDGAIHEEDFQESVLLSGLLPTEREGEFAKGLADLSGGKIKPEFIQ
jgi:uncharacterized YigZ family protein